MGQVDYQLLAKRQALLMHQRCAAELHARTDFLAYVCEAIKLQVQEAKVASLLRTIAAKIAQYKANDTQFEAHKAALTMELPEELPAQQQPRSCVDVGTQSEPVRAESPVHDGELRASEEAFNALQEKYVAARKEAALAAADCKALHTVLEGHQSTVQQLEQQLQISRNAAEQHRRDLEEARNSLEQRTRELEAARGATERQSKKVEASSSAFERQLRALEDAKAAVEEQLRATENARDAAENRIKELAKTQSASEEQTRRADAAKAAAEEQIRELQTATHSAELRITGLESAKNTLEQRVHELEIAKTTAERRAKELQVAKSAIDKRVEELESARIAHEEQVRKLDASRIDAEKQVRELQAAKHSAELRVRELEAVKLTLEEGSKDKEVLRATVEQRVRELEIAKGVAESRATDFEMLKNKAEKRVEELEAMHVTTLDQIRKLEASKTATEERIQELQAARDAAVLRAQELEATQKTLLDKNNDKEETRIAMEQQVRELESAKHAAEQQARELAAKLQQQAETFRAERDELMEAMAQELDELERTKSQQAREATFQQAQQQQEQREKIKELYNTITATKLDFKALVNLAAVRISATASALADIHAAHSRQALLVKQLTDNYVKEMRQRKRLLNEVQELRGNIRVFCRPRPLTQDELRQFGEGSICVTFPTDNAISVVTESDRYKTWHFDQVLSMEDTQEQMYSHISPLVQSAVDGYHVCILAYGQTGSGKTYTMTGTEDVPGLGYRALQELFDLTSADTTNFQSTVTASILEVYNEEIRDLLQQGQNGSVRSKLEVRQTDRGIWVPGLTELPVESARDVTHILEVATTVRASAQTNMNEHSSRSHMVLSINISRMNRLTGAETLGKLHLVDLAGSERLKKSGASGTALKEAQAINKSLSALGDVIAAKVSKQAHVPYRNSTLTYLLQDSLSRDSKTAMIVCVSPCSYNADETYCSLNFAARARNVELGPAQKHTSRR